MDSTDGDAIHRDEGSGDRLGADAQREASRTQDIRGVLIQVAGARLLMPNAAIAEVLSYADPEPVENTPDWLLGRIRWRGWQLPLIAFSRLAGLAEEQAGLGSKVVILKTFGGNPKFPFFALLTHGFPRLVTVSQAGLVAAGDGTELPAGVQAQVLLNEDQALLGEALAEAA
jgi:chemosensory pili system protein ChpC